MGRIIPYLNFEGKCAEAMEFYKSCFGGEIEMMKVGDAPTQEGTPPEMANNVMHSTLFTDSFSLFGSDMMGVDARGRSNIQLCYTGTVEDVRSVWSKLSAGATVRQELTEEFFGLFGELSDKYGFIWMFQADPPQHA